MVFVLDIGTKSVAGLLGTLQEDKIVVQHSAIEFHKKRAMYDGQIHDIEGVVEVVKKVKEELEQKAGIKLEEVAIAAAGRALKTHQIKIEEEIDEYKEIDRHFVNSIELEGIQRAQNELEHQSKEATNYFCVGHTVVNYYLDEGFIKNPIGHRGKKLGVDVLATFLPRIVVDSLYIVMSKVGLEVRYLTLEPIAAIEVAVPENMRLLNIALVDIGAGTSDIAITKEGRVIAYGMTSVAGDEITEEMAKKYLLDFDTAEKLKCNLCKSESQSFTDILGIQHDIATKDILDNIEPIIHVVASKIYENILEKNSKEPSVIFLIGGGSQIPRLGNILAEKFDMLKERVVIRGIESIANLQWEDNIFTGPEGIMPIGILVKTINNEARDFIEVEINSKKVKLFKTAELKASDALLLTDLKPRDLVPKKGDNLRIFVNDKEKIIYGEYGEAAEILVNHKAANLDTLINNGDIITIKPAREGKKARGYLFDIINTQEGFYLNDREISRVYNVMVNGEKISENKKLNNGDKVHYNDINNVMDLCDYLKIDFNNYDVYIEEEIAYLYSKIENNVKVTLKDSRKEEVRKEKKQESIEVIYNGETLKINSTTTNLIFVDIFNYIDFDRNEVKGKLVLKHNGKEANYTDPLMNGDEIWVYWDK